MRFCLCLFALAALCLAADPKSTVTLEGKLVIRSGKSAQLQLASGDLVTLNGDTPTQKVLGDERINGFDVRAKGHYTAARQFLIDPMHERALLVKKDGRLKMVTYWCEVCSIRAYTPGPCVCCQQETTLDLRDPDHLDDHVHQ